VNATTRSRDRDAHRLNAITHNVNGDSRLVTRMPPARNANGDQANANRYLPNTKEFLANTTELLANPNN